MEGLDAELMVVDNYSSDGSLAYLVPLFPRVRFISNKENLGFARANNLALPYCRGEYVLFLNPDTLVPEDCLHKCLSFIGSVPLAGALGVRMLDGRGRFLPESKRAFPSPMASFCKLTGLAALFPRSGFLNRYALGNLDEHQNHPVDVLAGAFMLVRRELLLQLQGFDESYFLYGEDIDLSYRIRQAGFLNMYFSGTRIIHFKGESSSRTELNRVGYFYKAMLVFVDKHYRSGPAKVFSWLIRFGIALRAMISVLNKIMKPFLLPLIDGILAWSSLQLVRMIWIISIRNGKDFGVAFIPYALPFFALLFVMAAAFMGMYDRIYKTSKALLSLAFATVSLLAVYSLLPEHLRFSRAVIVYGSLLGSGFVLLLRQFLRMRNHRFFGQEAIAEGQSVIVSNEEEYNEILLLLGKAMLDKKILGRISLYKNEKDALCSLGELAALEKQVRIREVIFCTGQLSLKQIISQLQELTRTNTGFLFHFRGTGSIVGSDTLAPGAKTVTAFIEYRIMQPYQQRMKRLVDVLVSFLFLLTAPVHCIIHKKGRCLLQNAWSVLKGKQTWVGYALPSGSLPKIKPAVISHLEGRMDFTETVLKKADRLYAKDYDWWPDLVMIFQHYRQLGQGC